MITRQFSINPSEYIGKCVPHFNFAVDKPYQRFVVSMYSFEFDVHPLNYKYQRIFVLNGKLVLNFVEMKRFTSIWLLDLANCRQSKGHNWTKCILLLLPNEKEFWSHFNYAVRQFFFRCIYFQQAGVIITIFCNIRLLWIAMDWNRLWILSMLLPICSSDNNQNAVQIWKP